MANRWGNNGNSGWLYFSGLQNHCRWWLQPWNEKTLTPWKENYDQPRQHIKKQRHYFACKVHLVKAMVFPVVMYRCKNWTIKKAECQSDERWKIDGWLASPSPWMWIWVNSGSWWWAGRPGVLPSIDSQRVGHNWTELMIFPVAMDRCDSWIIKKAES